MVFVSHYKQGTLGTVGEFWYLSRGQVHKITRFLGLSIRCVVSFGYLSTFRIFIFVMKISLTNSDSSSPNLQFFANSDNVSWNFSNDSFSLCLRPKNLYLS